MNQVNDDVAKGLWVAVGLFGLAYLYYEYGFEYALDVGWKVLVVLLLWEIRGRLKRD